MRTTFALETRDFSGLLIKIYNKKEKHGCNKTQIM